MTHKDYILIADHLNNRINDGKSRTKFFATGYGAAVACLCNALKSDNSNFSINKFLDAVLKEV